MRIFDLTMEIDERAVAFPGEPAPEIKQIATIARDGWNEKRITINSHVSTHIDAPFHMLENGKKLDDFPLEQFLGKVVIIDGNDFDSQLSLVKGGDIVFIHSDKEISERQAEMLIEKGIKLIGVDSCSPDSEPFNVHRLFFRHDILIVENLTNLERLVEKRLECIILPLKIKDADGAPCRVIAIEK